MGNPTHVLVVFYSRCGTTEKLALAAAVGAVQARADMRRRRLTDVTEDAQCRDEIARMRKEYVGPSERGILRAHATIYVLATELCAMLAECAVSDDTV